MISIVFFITNTRTALWTRKPNPLRAALLSARRTTIDIGAQRKHRGQPQPCHIYVTDQSRDQSHVSRPLDAARTCFSFELSQTTAVHSDTMSGDYMATRASPGPARSSRWESKF